jgi:hypothetical protein
VNLGRDWKSQELLVSDCPLGYCSDTQQICFLINRVAREWCGCKINSEERGGKGEKACECFVFKRLTTREKERQRTRTHYHQSCL